MSLELSAKTDFDMTSCASSLTLMERDVQMLATELDVEEGSCNATVPSGSIGFLRVRVVVSLVGKLVLPVVVGVYYAYLRNKNNVLESVRTQVVPAILSFLTNGISKSLLSVQGAVTNPTNKIDPILRVINLRDVPPLGIEEHSIHSAPEKSVSCSVLSEPPKGREAKADIVFIHGLNGSLVKTWKQGMWKMREECAGLERTASTGDLQDTNCERTSLKRCASTNSGCSAKVAKDGRGNRTVCECEVDECRCRVAAEGRGEPYTTCWPKDWLPIDCPDVRVIAITYTTDPYLWRPVWIKKIERTSIEERSSEMMEQLLQLDVGSKPIIWVGHSKGGLFVKQMLVDAWENACCGDGGLASLCRQTKGIMFYSVPHRGSSLADFSFPLIRKSVELLEIRRNCEKVVDLHERFLSICQDEHFNPEIFSFIETSLTFMSFLYLRIVAVDSADPGIGETCGVPLDHREICKPRGRDCFLYKQLVELIHSATES